MQGSIAGLGGLTIAGLPVVNPEGRLAGIVSVDDVLAHISAEFGEIGRLLRKQSPDSLATA